MMVAAPTQIDRLVDSVEVLTAALKVAQTSEGRERKTPASEVATLLFLARREGARLADLSEHLRAGPTTASSVVDRLVRRGMVDRRRPEEDRRSLHLSLTAAGRDVAQEIAEEQERWCRTMLDALDPEERDAFVSAMEKIAARLS